MSEIADQTSGINSVAAEPRTTVQAATMNTKVYLCLPWMKMTNPMTAMCLSGLVERRRTTTCLNFGDAFVSHSRNTCADLFLASNCDWSFWMDDDMLIPFGNAKWFNAYTGGNLPEQFAGLHAIDRLLSHGKTVVGGLYFGRHPHGAAMYSEGATIPSEKEFARRAPMNLVKPTRWVATGCLMIHRNVFLDIEKKFPRLARRPDGMGGQWFSSSEHNLQSALDRARAVLTGEKLSGEHAYRVHQILESAAQEARSKSTLGMGEDVQFCIRAAEAGHQPHVDMGLVCGHVGHCVYGPWNTTPRK